MAVLERTGVGDAAACGGAGASAAIPLSARLLASLLSEPYEIKASAFVDTKSPYHDALHDVDVFATRLRDTMRACVAAHGLDKVVFEYP
jgi:hypothetical protein